MLRSGSATALSEEEVLKRIGFLILWPPKDVTEVSGAIQRGKIKIRYVSGPEKNIVGVGYYNRSYIVVTVEDGKLKTKRDYVLNEIPTMFPFLITKGAKIRGVFAVSSHSSGAVLPAMYDEVVISGSEAKVLSHGVIARTKLPPDTTPLLDIIKDISSGYTFMVALSYSLDPITLPPKERVYRAFSECDTLDELIKKYPDVVVYHYPSLATRGFEVDVKEDGVYVDGHRIDILAKFMHNDTLTELLEWHLKREPIVIKLLREVLTPSVQEVLRKYKINLSEDLQGIIDEKDPYRTKGIHYGLPDKEISKITARDLKEHFFTNLLQAATEYRNKMETVTFYVKGVTIGDRNLVVGEIKGDHLLAAATLKAYAVMHEGCEEVQGMLRCPLERWLHLAQSSARYKNILKKYGKDDSFLEKVARSLLRDLGLKDEDIEAFAPVIVQFIREKIVLNKKSAVINIDYEVVRRISKYEFDKGYWKWGSGLTDQIMDFIVGISKLGACTALRK